MGGGSVSAEVIRQPEPGAAAGGGGGGRGGVNSGANLISDHRFDEQVEMKIDEPNIQLLIFGRQN